MSRSGYSDDADNLNLYRGTVVRALKGKRGQAFLRELATALDAMPEKTLIAGELVRADGCCCAIGAVCKTRGLDVSKLDYEDPDAVAEKIGVARCMAAEIAYMNDEFGSSRETPSERWQRIRKWVDQNLLPESK
jgi:hypothetical protein